MVSEILRDVSPQLMTVTTGVMMEGSGPEVDVQVMHPSDIDRIEGLAQDCANEVIGDGALVNIYVDPRGKGTKTASKALGNMTSALLNRLWSVLLNAANYAHTAKLAPGKLHLGKFLHSHTPILAQRHKPALLVVSNFSTMIDL